LLFEIISWIVTLISAGPNEVVSTPHLKATQQGLDTVKVSFDEDRRSLSRAVIYEQKCTENPRDEFRDGVLPAFRDWKSHKRDNQLLQAVTTLLERFNLTDEEHIRLYDRLIQDHPLVFDAALTVTPDRYETARCVALFAGFSAITPNIEDRLGNTFPIADIRGWFGGFANQVWQAIEAANV
jgi:hypothetical protein